MTPPRFDAIVVGSGFGGAVTALRLAERGMKVLVLERGPWWGPAGEGHPPGERRPFPRGLLGARKLLRSVRVARGGRARTWVAATDGLFEVHRFDALDVFTGSGVGGGSLVYTNILEAPPAHFWERLPPELTAAELREPFDRVRAILRPSPLRTVAPKTAAFAAAAARAGLGAVRYPDLALAQGADPAVPETQVNAAGVPQQTCNHCGTCVVGCTTRAKTTLDLTYLPMALAAGAELWPLSEALSVAAEGHGYRVRVRRHARDEEVELSADRLILAAGALQTLRLLFAARAAGGLPNVSARLGARFSPNADLLGFALRAGVGDLSRGPAFNAFVPLRAEDGRGFLLGEMGLPLARLPLPRFFTGPVRSAAAWVAMGEDKSEGTVRFEDGALFTDTGRSMDPALFAAIEAALTKLAAGYGARAPWLNLPSGRGAERLATVHPLGGAGIGRDAGDGVVDHRGEVFGHPRLFVADGALYPAAPGVPPSLTIAALAERQARLME